MVRESTKKTGRAEAFEYMKKRQATLKHCGDPRVAYTMLLGSLTGHQLEKQYRKEFALALLDGAADTAIMLRLAESLPSESHAKTIEALQARVNRQSPGLAVAYAAYCKEPKARPTKRVTLKAYGSIWKTFVKWSAERDLERVADVTETVAEDYAAHLQGLGRSASTYNHALRLLKAVWECCIRRHWAQANPWGNIPRMTKDTVHKRNLTLDELQRVLDTSDGWLKRLFTTGIYTGLRLVDCAYLETCHVNLEQNVIEIVPVKTQYQRKVISLPIHPSLREEIEARAKQKCKCIFPEAVKLYEAYPNAP